MRAGDLMVGDEYAAARALIDLGHQLLRAGRTDSAANEPSPTA